MMQPQPPSSDPVRPPTPRRRHISCQQSTSSPASDATCTRPATAGWIGYGSSQPRFQLLQTRAHRSPNSCSGRRACPCAPELGGYDTRVEVLLMSRRPCSPPMTLPSPSPRISLERRHLLERSANYSERRHNDLVIERLRKMNSHLRAEAATSASTSRRRQSPRTGSAD